MLLGLTAGIAPGPLSALVISQTLRFGPHEGVKIAMAPLITDLPVIVAAMVLGAGMAGSQTPLGLLALAGAAYLSRLAWENITMTEAGDEGHEAPPPAPKSLRRGMIANLLNPHPYLFWLTVGTPLVVAAWSAAPWNALIWIAGFYLMLVGAKILLVMIAGRSRHWLQGNGYVWLNRLLGTALLLLALLLATDGLHLMGLWTP